jgi:sucrose 6(F)-phosphate phosphorylase
MVKNKVQLITYPDSLGGDLKTLKYILQKYFSDICKGGVHILPPFPSSGDRGFAPKTYLKVDPRFGTWEDIRHIGEQFDILVDIMVNHISRRSLYFEDFLKKGRDSEYADMFITTDKLWPDSGPTEEEIDNIFLRRKKPFSEYKIEVTGKIEKIWTSFGKQDPSEQIDLDINSNLTKEILVSFLENFSTQKVKIVRLDALPYVIKKPGTNCFFVEPEVFQFLEWFMHKASQFGLEILPEVHDHYSTRDKLAGHGFWVYDFILPFTVLYSLITGNSDKLKHHLRTCPRKQITMLDCHDGVPVKPDLDGLITSKEAQKVVDICVERGSSLSRVYSSKYIDPDGFDVHQISGTYYSMLGKNDNAYLTARAIQFFTPGVPQVYYVGLLAGENDVNGMSERGDYREINRHNFTLEEINSAMESDVVQRLMSLIRFRNEYPAFNGTMKLPDCPDNEIHIQWKSNRYSCSLYVDLIGCTAQIEYIDAAGKQTRFTP